MNPIMKLISPSVRARAKARADDFNDDNPYTWREIPGRFLGFLGEEVVFDWLSVFDDVERSDGNPNYDCIFRGVKIDVKTKERNYRPRSDFEMSVTTAGMGLNQQCDVYLAVSVNPTTDYKEIWIVGWITKQDFLDKCKFFEKQGQWSNIPSDRYNVEFRYLNDPGEIGLIHMPTVG
jgi:hypothetical protein